MAFAEIGRLLPRKILAPAMVLFVTSSLAGCAAVDAVSDAVTGPGPEQVVDGDRISVLTLDESLSADPQIADMEITLPRAYTNMQWPQPGGSPTNAMQHLELEGELERVWRRSAGAGNSLSTRMTATPVMANGKIFALDAEAQVTAFDANTGERIWRERVRRHGESRRAGFGGGLAHGADRVIVATGFGDVYALNEETGERLWRRDVGVPIRTAPTVVAGRAFVVTTDNQLLAIDTRDGEVLWNHRAFQESAGLLASTSPAANADVVIAPFTSGELNAIRIQTGNTTWSDQLTRTGNRTPLADINAIVARPVIANGRVYAVSHSGRMVSIDLRTGERIWSINVGSTQTPWVAGEFLYVVSLDAELICISARDGRIRWITQMDPYENMRRERQPLQYVGPVLVSERLIVISSEGRMREYSPFTGEFIEETRVGDRVSIPPIVANNTLYVLTDNARVAAFRGEGAPRQRRARTQVTNTPQQATPGLSTLPGMTVTSTAPTAPTEEVEEEPEDGGLFGRLRRPFSRGDSEPEATPAPQEEAAADEGGNGLRRWPWSRGNDEEEAAPVEEEPEEETGSEDDESGFRWPWSSR